jgi:hypothetical protein
VSKRPAFQFYPSDWRTEAGLRLCSMGARGLWIEIMCLMHDCTPYGHLTVLGRAMKPDELARLVGEGAPAVKRWIGELESNEVFSRNDDGIIFSRRMTRDEEIREARAAGGSSGGEHGHKGGSHGSKGGRPRKEKPPLNDNQRGVSNPPPSSSSSSPSSEKHDDPYGSLSENDVSDPPAELPDDGDEELPEEPENSLKPQHVVDEWNQVALRCGLPQIVGLTGKRLRHLKARIREHPLDHWFEAFNAIERNPWMHGENDRGWRADFDFLLQPSSFQKLIEGSYDRAQPIQRTQ